MQGNGKISQKAGSGTIPLLLKFIISIGLSIATSSMGGLEVFVVDANEALKFRLLRTPEDMSSVEGEDDIEREFEPAMCHQIYGEKYFEKIS
jgi:hypothetical protein